MAEIYSMDGHELAKGLQSSLVCDEAHHIACDLARYRNETVIVEDHDSDNLYIVSPSGDVTPFEWGELDEDGNITPYEWLGEE